MKKPHSTLFLVFAAFATLSCASKTDQDSVSASLRRSADWQLANPSGISIHDWIIAPLYDGLLRTALTLDEPRYMAAVIELGQQATWAPGSRVYFADDHAIGHAWLDLYLLDQSKKERLEPMKDRLDYVIANPITAPLSLRDRSRNGDHGATDRWSWCDALYMAPPTLSRLYSATGDKKYLEFLDHEFQYTYDELWDNDEGFFYRDDRYHDQRSPNGKKIFWSRGNGWVYGGLALMLEHVPADHPKRAFYEDLFRTMTVAVVNAQQSDGLWRPSLLDPDDIPKGETSGTGFYTFGLAWGINNGLLDRDQYRDAAIRGWEGLQTRIGKGGMVGYVQPVGAAPDEFEAESTNDYGTGAFLLAGCEIYKMLGGEPVKDPAAVLAAAEKIASQNDREPRAYTRLVPERKDDLAWENDKVAFRIYGPALQESTEDSGIDVWCKRVDYPIIDKWYHNDLQKNQSYHTDHGEGYDGYKVGDTLGCGGVGLWIDGKLVTANVYRRATISWTSPDVAEFKVYYHYKLADDRNIFERRRVQLRLGENLFEVTSVFSERSSRRSNGIPDIPVVVGLTTQSAGAKVEFAKDAGYISMWDTLDGVPLASGAVFPPDSVEEMRLAPHTGKLQGHDHALAFLKTDKNGEITYRAGFGWSKAGEITSRDAWDALLQKAASELAE